MTRLDWIEILICVALYVPLGVQILQGKAKQNFATWSLWGVLDAIATASIICQHGNFAAAAIYTCGGTAMALCILKSKHFYWDWFETLVACIAVVCVIIWAISGPRNANIASTMAVLIAGGPLIRDAYREPWDQSLLNWFGFMVANILATIQGKNWSVQERFYPASCTILSLVLFLLTMQKLWIPQPIKKPKQSPIENPLT